MNNVTRATLAAALVVCASVFLLLSGSCGAGDDDDYHWGNGDDSCGNGVREGSEECDDGNTVNGDCCSASCQFESQGTACDDLLCSNGDAPGECDGAGACTGAPDALTGQCLVFLSSDEYYGNLGGLAAADAACQRLAEEEGLPGTYKAWLSDSQTSAADRLTHSIVPYVRVDDEVVANNWADLTDGSGLQHAISVSEGGYDWYNWCCNCFAVPGGCGAVWTATAPNGTLQGSTCGDWTNRDAMGGEGIYCLESSTSWTRWPDGTSNVDCQHARSLYCFQQ
ncbi:MAG: hypothetical protein JW797_01410 [Bradymonadales bacterium]|nr:hypothetical protein [Bradymonadales bacterium]